VAAPENSHSYRGRFAPSPTGPLHFGSLVAAVASYLQARLHKGAWLLRIEDLDPPREVPGAGDQIIRSLEVHGFEWSGPILWQSQRLELYDAAVQRLLDERKAYPCACTRQEIRLRAEAGPAGPIYPGTCRNGSPPGRVARAVRVRTGVDRVRFSDHLQGWIDCRMETEIGDYLIRRGDGLIAYQLAVVCDDAEQRVTEVVRGTDLLHSTSVQLHLQALLGLQAPLYMHFPVAANRAGQKLSKQTGAAPVEDRAVRRNLVSCLSFLRQGPPPALENEPVSTIWEWSVRHWRPAVLTGHRALPAPADFDPLSRT